MLALRQKLLNADNELQILLQIHGVDVKREIELNAKIDTLKETLDGLGFPHNEDTPVELDVDITFDHVSVQDLCSFTLGLDCAQTT